MASLKAAIRAARDGAGAETVVRGFSLVKPKLVRFTNPDAFLTALKDQSEHTALIDGFNLSGIDIDGRVEGADWRLSNAAFGDMCHWTKMPVSFIKRLAKIDEALTLEVIQEMLGASFHCGPDKLLVIDTRDGRVEGIVGKATYSPIGSDAVLEWAVSAVDDLGMSEGWLCGPTMRVTCTSEQRKAEPVPGDIVRMGMTLENSVHGDCSAKIADYAFRLKCSNGLTARDHHHSECIRHVGDVKFNVQKAIIAAAQRSEHLAPYMKAAAELVLSPEGIRSVRNWMTNPKVGGSPALDKKATLIAQEEAQDEGRKAEEVTLWNFVNGITASAKDGKTINRQTDLEALGYRTLVKFGAVLTS